MSQSVCRDVLNEIVTVVHENTKCAKEDNSNKKRSSTSSSNKFMDDTDCVEKINNVTVDVGNKCFALKVNPTQRKGKVKEFQTETFDFNIYAKSRKSVGFVTNRPVRWAMAFEQYIVSTTSTHCRWRYKQDSSKFSFAHLNLYYKNTQKVEISINFAAGSVSVNGENFKHFVETEFTKVQIIFDAITDFPCENEPDEPKDRLSDMSNSIELLWQKFESAGNAIETQDKVTQLIIERCQALELKVSNHDFTLPTLVTKPALLVVEKKLDEKITVFMEATLEKVEKLIKSSNDRIMSKINELRAVVRNIETKCGSATTDVLGDENDCVEVDVSKVDPEDLKRVLNLENVTRQIVSEEIGRIENSNAACENTIQEGNILASKITELEEKLQHFHDNTITISSASYDQKLADFDKQLGETRRSLTVLRSSSLVKPCFTSTKTDDAANSLSSSSGNQSHATTTTTTTTTTSAASQVTSGSRKDIKVDEELELLICFDSNWQHVDRKKLWKVNGSDLKRCGTLFEVSRVITSSMNKTISHLLLHVGTNDLDNKDHSQVFGELELLLDSIRLKFPAIRIIVSEILPRNDERYSKVVRFN